MHDDAEPRRPPPGSSQSNRLALRGRGAAQGPVAAGNGARGPRRPHPQVPRRSRGGAHARGGRQVEPGRRRHERRPPAGTENSAGPWATTSTRSFASTASCATRSWRPRRRPARRRASTNSRSWRSASTSASPKRRRSTVATATRELSKQRQDLEFLAQAGQLLTSSLDYASTLARLTGLIVPNLADWCAVLLEGAPPELTPGGEREPRRPPRCCGTSSGGFRRIRSPTSAIRPSCGRASPQLTEEMPAGTLERIAQSPRAPRPAPSARAAFLDRRPTPRPVDDLRRDHAGLERIASPLRTCRPDADRGARAPSRGGDRQRPPLRRVAERALARRSRDARQGRVRGHGLARAPDASELHPRVAQPDQRWVAAGGQAGARDRRCACGTRTLSTSSSAICWTSAA